MVKWRSFHIFQMLRPQTTRTGVVQVATWLSHFWGTKVSRKRWNVHHQELQGERLLGYAALLNRRTASHAPFSYWLLSKVNVLLLINFGHHRGVTLNMINLIFPWLTVFSGRLLSFVSPKYLHFLWSCYVSITTFRDC